MTKIKLTTLTPVHIGSGNLLQNNTDFVTTRSSEGNFIRIIDERKLYDLIGEEHMNDWLISIENSENTKDLVKRFSPQSKVMDYSSRRLINYLGDTIKPKDTLKECIHNGSGQAYIPGSSIKGAIRTAILSQIVEQSNLSIEQAISNGNRVSASNLEKQLFGQNVNEDLFRFLQVGDAYFDSNVEIAIKMVNINIRSKGKELWDTTKSQIIEAIAHDNSTEFELRVKSDVHNFVKRANPGRFNVKDLYAEMNSISNLFETINHHTEKLLREEVDFWEDYDEDEDALSYIDQINDLLETIEGLNRKRSCVIRIGHGSGWNFITGAWSKKMGDRFDQVVTPKTRPRNNLYEEYPFPKTRRMDLDGDILGFVRMDLVEN